MRPLRVKILSTDPLVPSERRRASSVFLELCSSTGADPSFPEINESTEEPSPGVTNPVVENIKIPRYNVGLMEPTEGRRGTERDREREREA